MRGVLPVVLGLVCLAVSWIGCGGTVFHDQTSLHDADASVDADASKKDGSKDGAPDAKLDGGKDALSDYFDPGCPDAPLPVIDNQCDPLAPPPGDCMQGEACYPYVIYPSDPCEAEYYGSMCSEAGTSVQDEPCYGGAECAPGFTCVVSGAGTICVQMCDLHKLGSCPDGRVCEPIDVLGYGGCL